MNVKVEIANGQVWRERKTGKVYRVTGYERGDYVMTHGFESHVVSREAVLRLCERVEEEATQANQVPGLEGLTPRDVFAGLALAGLVSNHEAYATMSYGVAAEEAYKQADAMIRARTKDQGETK